MRGARLARAMRLRAATASILPLVALLVTALAVPPAGAQMDFSQAWQLRGAIGDIPTTGPAEDTSSWNLAETHVVIHDGGSRSFLFTPLAGYTGVDLRCTCQEEPVTADDEGAFRFTFNASIEAGTYELTFTQRVAVDAGEAFPIQVPAVPESARSDAAVIFYLPAGYQVTPFPADVTSDEPLPSPSKQGFLIHTFRGTPDAPFAPQLAFAAYPTQDAIGPAVPEGGGFDWLALALGVLGGAVVWAVLVQQGVVQKRSRKQVASQAVHKEVAKTEPVPVLEGRKRALMAALKELEMAKMQKEMDTEVYDQLKARFKREAVTVMRALEEAKGSG